MQKKINALLCTLMDLRDAFEEIHGGPDNAHSQLTLRVVRVVRYWEEEYGVEALQKAANRHEERAGEWVGEVNRLG